jgi:uncharacterized protein
MKLLIFFIASLAAAQQAPQYSAEVLRDVMVPMRDGVKLAADVYLPARAGTGAPVRLPTLISRTPYDKSGLRAEAEWYAQHGYAVVAQDVRGRFRSEGTFYPFIQEGPDGYDTIEWAAAQDWSNGKIGTFGASYLAWDQYRAAMERPPHLVAMFANVGGAEFYQEFAYPGGAPNLAWGIWIAKSAETSPPAQTNADAKRVLTSILQNPAEWFRQSPQQRASVFQPFPVHRRIYQDYITHTQYDDYWRDPGFSTPAGWQRIKDVPILFISGWYDYFGNGVLKNFVQLSKLQKTEKQLVMGPWPHGVGGSACGDGFFGNAALTSVRELTLAWFDRWLRDQAPGSLGETVRYFRMGGGNGAADERGRRTHGGTWLTAAAWPPPSGRALTLYLGGDGRLIRDRAADAAPRTFTYDPADPVPTIGGRYGVGGWTPNCFQNQVCRPGILGCNNSEPLAARSDVLVFATEALPDDLEVTGPVRARLWVSSDAPDTDFTAKLIDVAPDGYAAILADGQFRVRYRDGFSRERPLKAGEIAAVDIDLGATSNLFAKGHRIRVDISSSNWPQVDINPNTGAPVNANQSSRKARNTVYLDGKRASYVELTVVPVK